MYRCDLRRERTSIGEALDGSTIKSSNRNNKAMANLLWVYRQIQGSFLLKAPIMVRDPQEEQDHHRNQCYDNPSPFNELHRCNNKSDEGRSCCPCAIADQTAQPSPLCRTQVPPVHHHTSL